MVSNMNYCFVQFPRITTSIPRNNCSFRYTIAACERTQPPVERNPNRRFNSVSYAMALAQISTALQKPITNSKLTIELPPEYSETRAGTLVSRFENNLNFSEKLLKSLGASTIASLGGDVEIRDNVNPQGGGEYLTDDETMVGFRAKTTMADIMVLLNAGVDPDTLKQVKQLEEKDCMLLLVNCGLERLSWLDKLKLGKYFDDFDVLYYLRKVAGNGWLFKCGDEEWGVWIETESGIQLLTSNTERPKIVDAERDIRLAAAGIRTADSK